MGCAERKWRAHRAMFSNLRPLPASRPATCRADLGMARGGRRPRTRLMFRERSPNPLMEVTDLEAFASIGAELGP